MASKSKLPVIRFIVTTVSSERDRNGNSYHFAHIRSTITGKQLTMTDVGGTRNAVGDVCRATGKGYEIVHTEEIILPKRQWQAASKAYTTAIYCGNVTAQMILDLEKA